MTHWQWVESHFGSIEFIIIMTKGRPSKNDSTEIQEQNRARNAIKLGFYWGQGVFAKYISQTNAWRETARTLGGPVCDFGK